jgi:hypothetical protein
MSTPLYNRTGKRWTINETLSLQRQFELLNLSIDEMAAKHQRTPNAIMFKLDYEGWADYNELYADYHDVPPPLISDSDSETNVSMQPIPHVSPNVETEARICILEKKLDNLIKLLTKPQVSTAVEVKPWW